MSAREEILARVRSATADVSAEPSRPRPESGAEVARLIARSADPSSLAIGRTRNQSEGTLGLFAENVADYRAIVLRVAAAEVPATIVDALRSASVGSVVVPDGVDPTWRAALEDGFEVVAEAVATTAQALDAIDAVVTASAVGIATTGTIVLDHEPDQGRRALTLVPDCHVCVIHEDQVVHDVPEAVERLAPDPGRHPRPLTWISGPSATSDIELQRVEGVHGPRTLIVILAGAA